MPRTIFENIVIQHFEKTTFFEYCQYTSIRFFEIIHFKKGEGTIKINGNAISYKSNSFFVFIPDDVYVITVDTPTTITTIKFLKSFFSNASNSNSVSQINDWFRKIEISLNNENRIGAFQFQSEPDKRNLSLLVDIFSNSSKTF